MKADHRHIFSKKALLTEGVKTKTLIIDKSPEKKYDLLYYQ